LNQHPDDWRSDVHSSRYGRQILTCLSGKDAALGVRTAVNQAEVARSNQVPAGLLQEGAGQIFVFV
jgi:hypothetical protein